MLQTAALFLMLAAPGAAAGPEPGVFVMGQARFTVLAPECVRIEYSTSGLFVDEPSVFARQRQARFLGYNVELSTGRLMLDTGRLRLTYAPDGWPLSVANLKAEIRIGSGTVTWTPERNGEGGLEAGRLLSRAGWHVVDDSRGKLLKAGRPAARPAGRGTDWFLFAYGFDFKAGLRALSAVTGAAPMPRGGALDRELGAGFPRRLREELAPYLLSSAWQAYERGLPLRRPLYLEHPQEDEAYRYPRETYIGDSILELPRRQAGWLPQGAWFDLSTGGEVRGPAELAAAEGPGPSRLYAKGGLPIVMRLRAQEPAARPLRTLVLRAYPGPDAVTGRAVLYEDDGRSRDYVAGGRALTDLSYLRQGGRVRIMVEPTVGSFKGQPAQRSYVVELPGPAADRAVLDGQTVPVQYSAQENLSRVSLPARDIRRGFTLYVWLP